MKAQFPGRVISIAYHEKKHFSDPMSTPAQEEFLEYYEKQFNTQVPIPGMLINRSPDEVFIGKEEMFLIGEALDAVAPATVTIDHTWNATTRTATGSVKVIFDSFVDSSDYRVGLIVVEDDVQGGYYYNQRNYYHTSTEYFELIGLGENIKDYKHYDVYRDNLLGGPWGKDSVVPDVPDTGVVYATPFTYTVPQNYLDIPVKLDKIKLVAYVAHNQDLALNAAEVTLLPITSIDQRLHRKKNQCITINSTQPNCISLTLTHRGLCKLSLFAATGREVSLQKKNHQILAGTHTLSFAKNRLASGVYFLRLLGDEVTAVVPLVVSR